MIDHNGWSHFNYHLSGGWFLLEAHLQRREVCLSYGGSSKYRWIDRDACLMALASLERGEPLHPLLDYLQEQETNCEAARALLRRVTEALLETTNGD